MPQEVRIPSLKLGSWRLGLAAPSPRMQSLNRSSGRTAALTYRSELLCAANVIPKADCDAFIRSYRDYGKFSDISDGMGNKYLYYSLLQQRIRSQARLERTIRAVADWLGTSSFRPPLYLETLLIAMLPKGRDIAGHADNEKFTGRRWVRNHTPERCYTAILYLNSDFQGGELCFEALGLNIKPRAGLLVAFPSDHRFIHSVGIVTRGYRYSMALWYTRNRKNSLLPEMKLIDGQ